MMQKVWSVPKTLDPIERANIRNAMKRFNFAYELLSGVTFQGLPSLDIGGNKYTIDWMLLEMSLALHRADSCTYDNNIGLLAHYSHMRSNIDAMAFDFRNRERADATLAGKGYIWQLHLTYDMINDHLTRNLSICDH